ncbi:hypothetical protein COE58_10470 [Bacillus cereus]|nr:hypothetical protein COE58_10470 [Bacillus cereus]HDR7824872.1 hypothetical protein [Bacillus anthracis]
MAMAILFRNKDTFNPFKRAMLDLIAEDGDTLILSSGYIDLGIAEELIDGIKNSFSKKHGELIIIAGHIIDNANTHYQNHKSTNKHCHASKLPFRGYTDFLNGEKIPTKNYVNEVINKYRYNSSHYFSHYLDRLPSYVKRKPDKPPVYYMKCFENELNDLLKSTHLSTLKSCLEKNKMNICWYCHINLFTWYLRDKLQTTCPNLNIRVVFATDFLEHSWHSKIAMMIKNNTPIASIIGSSNLTKAVWKEGSGRFHFEADIYIKSNSTDINLHSNGTDINSHNDPLSFSVVHVDPRNVSESQLLNKIYHSLKGSANI